MKQSNEMKYNTKNKWSICNIFVLFNNWKSLQVLYLKGIFTINCLFMIQKPSLHQTQHKATAIC